MPAEKVTILDGTRPGDKNLEPLLATLNNQLKYTGAEVRTFTQLSCNSAYTDQGGPDQWTNHERFTSGARKSIG